MHMAKAKDAVLIGCRVASSGNLVKRSGDSFGWLSLFLLDGKAENSAVVWTPAFFFLLFFFSSITVIVKACSRHWMACWIALRG